MSARKTGQKIIIALAFITFCAGANAEKTVYKWVDEDGVVHFGDAPPADANVAETETLIIPKSPPPAESKKEPAVAATKNDSVQPMQPIEEAPQLYVKTDVSQLSLADLDLRCDEAREEMIAPLREAEIEKCKQDKREDPAFCERFNADFGEGGRTVSGSIRPRMFDDLPKCVEAKQEKHRRGR
jgi:hypothetical protein